MDHRELIDIFEKLQAERAEYRKNFVAKHFIDALGFYQIEQRDGRLYLFSDDEEIIINDLSDLIIFFAKIYCKNSQANVIFGRDMIRKAIKSLLGLEVNEIC